MNLEWLLGAVTSRIGKWVTLALWVLIAGLIIPLAPTLSDITTNDTLQFLPDDAESTRAAELVRERFPSDSTPAIIVLHNESGLSDADLAAAEEISAELVEMTQESASNVASVVSPSTIPQASEELISPDGTTMTIVVNVTGSPAEDAYSDRIEAIRAVTDGYDGAELQVKVTGPGGLLADLVSVFANIDTFLLLVTVSLVLVLLIVIYRSPVVAMVPIVLVGVVFQLSSGIGALILDAVDFAVSGQTTGIMTVILFGAGTDYILFISARYREELRRTEDKHLAMRRAISAVGGAIASAAGTLIVASSILLLADLGSFRSLGPVVALAIAIMMLAAITLVPASLAILGRFAFWPFRPHYEPSAVEDDDGEQYSPVWGRIARVVLARPATVLATTGIVLLLLTGGMTQLESSYDSLESLPSDVDSVEGFELLRAGFPAGELAPTSVYVRFPDGESVLEPENLEAVAAVTSALQATGGIADVNGPANPRGLDAQAVLASIEQIPPELREELAENRGSGTDGLPDDVRDDPELAESVALYQSVLDALSTDLGVARLEVVLDVNPYGPEAMDLIPEIRDVGRDIAEDLGLGRDAVLVGGETAQNADTRAATNRDTLLVLPLVLVAIMIILGLLLRSVVAAAYLGVTIIVTYFATLGLAILCFTFIFGQDTIGSGVPFLLFIFLNALGVDYSIYLMSRIREETRETELERATQLALARTGGVITSAGLILAGTFAALMTLPLRDLFQLGFAVSVGVLMDTFITRSLLVPSLVKLLGRWNWWPSQASRREPAPAAGERATAPGD